MRIKQWMIQIREWCGNLNPVPIHIDNNVSLLGFGFV